MKFSDLFTGFGSGWPTDLVNTSWPPSSDVTGLLAQINDGIELHDVLTDVDGSGTVTVNATLKAPTPPARTDLVSARFPSLRFVFAPELGWSSGFRVSAALDGTVSLQIDAFPLQVLFPSDLLAAHPNPDMGVEEPWIDLTTSTRPSVISRAFTVTLEATGDLRLDPHLPISIGPCTLFGLSMTAVHDIQLIFSPGRAFKLHDWVVRPLVADAFPLGVGGLGFGGLELDRSDGDSAIASVLSRLKIADDADLVFEDLVFPAAWVPVPVYGTGGIRKSLQPGESLLDHLTFTDAPILIPLGESAHLFFSQLFFKMPAEDEPILTGLSIEGGVALDAGGDDADGDEDWEVGLGLIEGDLVRATVARTPPHSGEDIPLLRLDLFSHVITIFRLRAGVSISSLQESNFDGDAIQVLVDILIQKKPEDPDDSGSASPVRIEGEDGQPFVAALTDLGWDRGKPSGNITMPRKATLVLGKFGLVIHELGLTSEHGATYINISGAIQQKTDPFTGKLWFTRLRGKLAGNADAPGFKLGGLGVDIGIKDVVEISAHGSYRDELLPNGTRVKEQGLGGKLVIYAGGNKWGLQVDVYWGEQIQPGEHANDYLLFQVVLFGALPLGPVELSQIEALYADSLLPKLDEGDREAGELKYYNWLKRARRTAVAEERGLTAWTPKNDAWAFGLGLGISFTGCGDVCLLTAFGLGFNSEDASGLVIVLELKLFGGDTPLALGIFEYDFRTDAFVIQIQIDLALEELIKNFPKNVEVRVGGTFTFGNKPGLVAVGRLDHVETWLGAKIQIDLSKIVVLVIHLGLCFEWLEGVHVGGGFTFSISAKGDLGIIRLEGWGSLLVVVKFMISGTNDFMARIAFDAGFALVLFGFLRFGISVSLLAEWLAHFPDFFMFRATFRLETPWFLPDVSYTLECVRGEIDPASRGMVTSPLLNASARSEQRSTPAQVRRLDGLAGGSQPLLFSVNELRAAVGEWQPSEHLPTELVPLHATIEIQFSPMLHDTLRLGGLDLNADLGSQITGDDDMRITARYALTGLEVRRRAVGSDVWEPVESITSASGPRMLCWAWDEDTRTGGETAPKKLLLNGATPFSVAYENPTADNEILTEHPSFPCCDVRSPDVARLDFRADPLGPLPGGFVRHLEFVRRATRAPIRMTGGPCAIREPLQAGADNDRVGCFVTGSPEISIAAREDVYQVRLNLAVIDSRKGELSVVARDVEGKLVFRKDLGVGGNMAFTTIDIVPGQPLRTVDVRLRYPQEPDDPDTKDRTGSIVLDYAECVTSADRNLWEADRARCDRLDSDGDPRPINFLANHEYEIVVSTRISVEHTSTEPEAANLQERVRFVTAGPPGLNETPEPGLELRPHVVSANAGGRGVLYRDESVHLVLSEEMRVFGPGPGGDGETGYRVPVSLTVAPVFTANPDDTPARSSFTADEWFLAKRGGSGWFIALVVLFFEQALTDDPLRLRYRELWDASSGTCEPDDIWVEKRPRLGVDPFDARGRPLWEPRTSYHATMRPDGGPLVERKPFEPEDVTAFGSTTGSWAVHDGRLIATGAASATFGEREWDLFHLELSAAVSVGGSIDATVLIDPDNPDQGVRFVVDRNSDGSGQLRALSMRTGAEPVSRPIGHLGENVVLLIDTFADRIRCVAGGATISLPRKGWSSGTCAIGGTDVAIQALRVHALEMYGFDFKTSRYERFADHISSASDADEYVMDNGAEALGALETRLAGEVANAMQPGSSDADRESVFAEIASALAMPLREDPERLHVEVGIHDEDRWFLLESPEPIDFVSEVTVSLQRKNPISPAHMSLAARVLDPVRILIADEWPGLLRPPLHDRHEGDPEPPDGVPFLLAPAGFTLQVVAAGVRYTHLRSGISKTLRVRLFLSPFEARRLKGVVLGFDARGKLIDWKARGDDDWGDVAVVPIQNGDATKAFLLPSTTGQLPDGHYRMRFHIERPWFKTIDVTGPGNTYIDDADIMFVVGSASH